MPSGPYDAIVLGAGLTGLTVTARLRARGRRVLLIEKSARAGGAVRSTREDGFLWEAGPNSMLLKEALVERFLVDDLALGEVLREAGETAKKRFIVRHGAPQVVPHSPLGAVTTHLFSPLAKLRILGEPFRPRGNDPEESVASFVRRRLGPEFLDYAIGPMVSGVFAGDPEQLAIRHAFPKVWRLEDRHDSLIRGALALKRARKGSEEPRYKARMVSFTEGLETIVRALVTQLGRSFITEATTTSILRESDDRWRVTARRRGESASLEAVAPHLIVTVPTHAWNDLPWPDAIGATLTAAPQPPHPPVATLNLGYRREQVGHPLDGVGMLVPQVANEPLLGTIFSSTLFSGRAPADHVLLMLFLGGVTQPAQGEAPTASALASVRPALERLLGVKGDPVFVRHTRWTHAIPQYDRRHANLLAALEQVEQAAPGLHLIGSFRGGPGLSDVIGNALRLAEHLNR